MKEVTVYLYIKTEPGLWTVGFHDPSGLWQPESDHSTKAAAAKRVAWLNGANAEAAAAAAHKAWLDGQDGAAADPGARN